MRRCNPLGSHLDDTITGFFPEVIIILKIVFLYYIKNIFSYFLREKNASLKRPVPPNIDPQDILEEWFDGGREMSVEALHAGTDHREYAESRCTLALGADSGPVLP